MEIMATINWKSGQITRWYVGGVNTTCVPTGTTPGTAEARYVTTNALAASVDFAMWTLFPHAPRPLQGLTTIDCMRPFTSDFSIDKYSTRAISTALLQADCLLTYSSVGRAITRHVTSSIHPVVEIPAYRRKVRARGG